MDQIDELLRWRGRRGENVSLEGRIGSVEEEGRLAGPIEAESNSPRRLHPGRARLRF